jgi:hypothetical protein
MPTYQLDLKSDQGFGVVLYVEAASLEDAKAQLETLDESMGPQLEGWMVDDKIEARLYLYGEELAQQNVIFAWDDEEEVE